MMDRRKLKIVFIKEDGAKLTLQDIESMLKDVVDQREKWFLRGIKHILENHHNEAIKRLQLVDNDEANLLIVACAYKLKDDFILNEYVMKQLDRVDMFEKFGFYPYFIYNNSCIKISSGIFDEDI